MSPPNPAPVATLVTGMHRSGTSALTRFVATGEGFSLGDENLLIGASRTNSHGHFEREEFTRFNDRLIEAAGGHWTMPNEVSSDELVRSSTGLLGDEGRQLLERLQRDGVNLLKDPRLCITLPFWVELAGPRAFNIVGVIREPNAVAASLVLRNRLTPFHARFLWRHYNEALLENTAGLAVQLIDFADLTDKERNGSIGIHDKPPEWFDSSVIDNNAVHHRGTGHVEAADGEIYGAMLQWAHGEIAYEEASARVSELVNQLEAPSWNALAARNAREVTRLERELHIERLKVKEERSTRNEDARSHGLVLRAAKDETKRAEDELKTTRAQVAALEASVGEMSKERDDAAKALDKKRKENLDLALKLDASEQRIEALEQARAAASGAGSSRTPSSSIYGAVRGRLAQSDTAVRIYRAVKSLR